MQESSHNLRVIYGDTDQMGVVYYANYLRYFEAGRNELMRALQIPYRELEADGFLLPVSSVEVQYRAPARYDDSLRLRTMIAEVGRASIRITYELVRPADETLIATGETRHACLGPGGRVTRFPTTLLRKLRGDEVEDES